MHPTRFAALFLLFIIGPFTGCATSNTPVPAPATPTPRPPVHLTTNGHVAPGEKIDHQIARDDVEIVMQLDIYTLTVPFGAISSVGRFWKHVDEDHLDLATHALLLNNGIRYGIGPNSEWDYFKGLIEHYGATAQKGSVAPVKKGAIELPMQKNIPEQLIFYLNEHQKLYGRSYEQCDNLLSLTFEPTPRHPGDARINLCAMVRGLRKQYQVTILNEARDIEFKYPEYLYDLRLCQDVALDHFLVLGPSPVATLPDCLGHTFFVHPNGPEPVETVLIMVPRPYRVNLEAAPSPVKTTAPAK
jgi:hypothetical protein